MDRRKFITVASAGMLAPVRKLVAEHHVVNADPLMVDFDLQSLEGRYTSTQDFYVRNHADAPRDSGPGILQIEGEVEIPKRLSADDVAHLPKRSLGAVLECAGNLVDTLGKVSNGEWEGWLLGDVLSLARPKGEGMHLHLFGRDGYARSVPMERADATGMLVTHLNRRPLDRQHGAPWRALFPGWYGMDSVKWLDRLAVSRTPLASSESSYMALMRGPLGEVERRPLPQVQIKSVILNPPSGAVLRRGTVEVRGLAWSGEGRVSAVEVSSDGEISWRPATLDLGSRYEWALWHSEIEINHRGAVEIVCRAYDEKGLTQPARRDPRRLDGYVENWYHRVRCVIV